MANEIQESLTSPMQLETDENKVPPAGWAHCFTSRRAQFRTPHCHCPSVWPAPIADPHKLCVWPFIFSATCPLLPQRDITASLLKETCHGVTSETFNRTTANRQKCARLDVVANVFCGISFERPFFDVSLSNRILSPSCEPKKEALRTAYKRSGALLPWSSLPQVTLAQQLQPSTNAWPCSMLSEQPYSTTIGLAKM